VNWYGLDRATAFLKQRIIVAVRNAGYLRPFPLQIAIWSIAMKKLVLAIAVAGTALLGGSAANAADNNNTVNASAANDVATQPTDVSARKKHHSRRHYRTGRHWSYRHYRPYYRSYGYAPRPYYGDPYGYRYGYGGPGVTFSFGTGGYRGW
jgi:Ni/Co efflux regulator RcnB